MARRMSPSHWYKVARDHARCQRDPSAMLTIVALQSFMDANGECFPSHRTLAEAALISRPTLRAALTRLRQWGLLAVTERTRDAGQAWAGWCYAATCPDGFDLDKFGTGKQGAAYVADAITAQLGEVFDDPKVGHELDHLPADSGVKTVEGGKADPPKVVKTDAEGGQNDPPKVVKTVPSNSSLKNSSQKNPSQKNSSRPADATAWGEEFKSQRFREEEEPRPDPRPTLAAVLPSLAKPPKDAAQELRRKVMQLHAALPDADLHRLARLTQSTPEAVRQALTDEDAA